MIIRTFRDSDAPALVALWTRCGLTRPWNDPAKDIARRVALPDDLFLVGATGADDAPIGSAMVGYDGHRGWINYLAVDPAHRRRGHARALIEEAERRLLRRGCPKLNLQVRSDNPDAVAFYERLGYTVDAAVSLGKRLIPDD